jgi:hypothetical protein
MGIFDAARSGQFGRMAACLAALGLALALVWGVYHGRRSKLARNPQAYPKIQPIDPPEEGFFTVRR